MAQYPCVWPETVHFIYGFCKHPCWTLENVQVLSRCAFKTCSWEYKHLFSSNSPTNYKLKKEGGLISWGKGELFKQERLLLYPSSNPHSQLSFLLGMKFTSKLLFSIFHNLILQLEGCENYNFHPTQHSRKFYTNRSYWLAAYLMMDVTNCSDANTLKILLILNLEQALNMSI